GRTSPASNELCPTTWGCSSPAHQGIQGWTGSDTPFAKPVGLLRPSGVRIPPSPRSARSSIWIERLATDQEVGGSSPSGRTELSGGCPRWRELLARHHAIVVSPGRREGISVTTHERRPGVRVPP